MSFADRIRPFVDAELRAAREDQASEFTHLERAHVLGQASTREHVRVHWRMVTWAGRPRAKSVRPRRSSFRPSSRRFGRRSELCSDPGDGLVLRNVATSLRLRRIELSQTQQKPRHLAIGLGDEQHAFAFGQRDRDFGPHTQRRLTHIRNEHIGCPHFREIASGDLGIRQMRITNRVGMLVRHVRLAPSRRARLRQPFVEPACVVEPRGVDESS